MVSQQGPARRPTTTSRAEKQRLREIAQLRARRAARRSNEVAAGKRRMVLSGFFAALTVLVGVLAAVSAVVSWAWALLPFAALLTTLMVSRMAAVRFEEASRAEQARLEELMGLVPLDEADAVEHGAERPHVERPHDEGDASVNRQAAAAPVEATEVDIEAEVATEAAVEADIEDAEAVDADGVAEGAVESAGNAEGKAEVESEAELAAGTGLVAGAAAVEAPSVPSDTPAGERGTASSTSQNSAPWVPTPIPAPMYAQRPRVGGRLVHPDTDLRGIPKVAASVPMRPSGVSESGTPLRSTEEVAASQPVAFDLDAVLESRRAL